jgi:hypothetical protein
MKKILFAAISILFLLSSAWAEEPAVGFSMPWSDASKGEWIDRTVTKGKTTSQEIVAILNKDDKTVTLNTLRGTKGKILRSISEDLPKDADLMDGLFGKDRKNYEILKKNISKGVSIEVGGKKYDCSKIELVARKASQGWWRLCEYVIWIDEKMPADGIVKYTLTASHPKGKETSSSEIAGSGKGYHKKFKGLKFFSAFECRSMAYAGYLLGAVGGEALLVEPILAGRAEPLYEVVDSILKDQKSKLKRMVFLENQMAFTWRPFFDLVRKYNVPVHVLPEAIEFMGSVPEWLKKYLKVMKVGDAKALPAIKGFNWHLEAPPAPFESPGGGKKPAVCLFVKEGAIFSGPISFSMDCKTGENKKWRDKIISTWPGDTYLCPQSGMFVGIFTVKDVAEMGG